jgi:hypothetical protein
MVQADRAPGAQVSGQVTVDGLPRSGAIAAGATLVTESQATLTAPGVQLDLDAATTVTVERLADPRRGSHFRLSDGVVRCAVDPALVTGPVSIQTPDAEVQVRGTIFTVRYTPEDGTRVTVEEGEVAVIGAGNQHNLVAGAVYTSQPAKDWRWDANSGQFPSLAEDAGTFVRGVPGRGCRAMAAATAPVIYASRTWQSTNWVLGRTWWSAYVYAPPALPMSM